MVKTTLTAALAVLTLGSTAMAAETAPFCPEWWHSPSMTGDGVLEIWGVPEANGKAFKANPDYDWPTVEAIAEWSTSLKNARTWNYQSQVREEERSADGLAPIGIKRRCLVIYYDPTPDSQGHYKITNINDRMQ